MLNALRVALRSHRLLAGQLSATIAGLVIAGACGDDPVSTDHLEMVAHAVVTGRVLDQAGNGVTGAVVGLGAVTTDPAATTYVSNTPVTTTASGVYSLEVRRDRGAPNKPVPPSEVPVKVIATMSGGAIRTEAPVTLRFGPIAEPAPVVPLDVTVP
jgi:hypothetical protein